MGLIPADLEDPKISDKDKAEIKIVLDRFRWNDIWVNKIFKKVAILLTSHPGNRPYLKATVESYKKLDYWICLVYDNYLDPDNQSIDYNSVMPARDVIDNVNLFIQSPYQRWGGVLFPYFFHLKFGCAVLQDFEYIFCSNGDCLIEKPENFNMLFEELKDNDIIGCGPVRERSFNTAGFLIKTKAFKALMQHFQDHFIPFEKYVEYTQEIGNTEGRFMRAIKDLGLKLAIVSEPIDEQVGLNNCGWWKDNLGFRHLHAEHNQAYRYKGIPPHYKYLDERFMGDEFNKIKAYWETKDTKILEEWWAK